jgi:hypothetical protein
MTIENANRLFDPHEAKKKTRLPPGNVTYTEDFLKTISKLLEKEDQEEINDLLLRLMKKVYSIAIETKDPEIKSIAPSNKADYCCWQCGVNHESRDFLRAVLLYMIDQFEESKDFIEFLEKNGLVTKEAYSNVLKKLK